MTAIFCYTTTKPIQNIPNGPLVRFSYCDLAYFSEWIRLVIIVVEVNDETSTITTHSN